MVRAGDFLWDKNLLSGVFSFSKLNTYAKCPRRARFRYIEGRKEGGLHLVRGRAGHAGQEIDNRAKLRGERLSLEQVLEGAVGVLREELGKEPGLQERKAQQGREVDKFVEDHRVHLEVFDESGERARIIPVVNTVEAPFEIELRVEQEPAMLQGFVDLLTDVNPEDGGPKRVVVDYKTVKRAVSVGDAERSLQFELYRIAAGASGIRVVSFVESGRQRATTRVVETPPRGEGGPAQEKLLTWVGETVKSFRRSIVTGDWPRCSPESYWCSPSACGFYGECYPKRAPGLERLVAVGAVRGPGTLPQPEWRGTYGGGGPRGDSSGTGTVGGDRERRPEGSGEPQG